MKCLFGSLRVLSLAVALVVALAFVSLRRAEARLLESLRGIGGQIAQLYDSTPQRVPRKLVVNGIEFGVMTASTPLEVPRALDRFESLCRSIEELDIPTAIRRDLEVVGGSGMPSTPLGALRQDGDEEGILACLDVGTGLDIDGFLSKLANFGRTLNLREVGELRYVLARRENGVTRLLAFWTEGDFGLTQAFPPNGDAPGRDLDGLPKPEHSQRLFSAFQQGMPYGIATYVVAGQSQEAVIAEYRRRLEASGWRAHAGPRNVVMAERGGRMVVVQVGKTRSGRIAISLSDLG